MDKFRAFFTKIHAWFYIQRIRLQWLWAKHKTKNTKLPVPTYTDVNEIAKALKWGDKWRADEIDSVTHPQVVQYNIENNLPIDDCDGHACYSTVSFKKAKLVKKVWYSLFFFKDKQGKNVGHAVYNYLGWDNQMYFGDYNLPKSIPLDKKHFPNAFDWLGIALPMYGSKLKNAYMIEVIGVKKDDTPIFGKIKAYNPKHKITVEEIIEEELAEEDKE